MWESAKTALTILGSLGVFKFLETIIPFLINRKDKKLERKEEREDRIKELENKIEKGLAERSAEGKQRFDKHALDIQKQMQVSQQRYDEIKQVLLDNAKDNAERDLYMHTMGDALMGIIHDRVLHNTDQYIERGCTTREELATLESMFKPYTELGGNGDVKKAFEIVNELPVVSKEEAARRDLELKRSVLNVVKGT